MPSRLIHYYHIFSLVTDQRTYMYFQERLHVSAKRGHFLLNVTFEILRVRFARRRILPHHYAILRRIIQGSRQPRLKKFHRVVATGCAKEVSLRLESYFLTGDPPSTPHIKGRRRLFFFLVAINDRCLLCSSFLNKS